MTPPCEPFTASELLVKVQENVDGKRRKMVAGQRRIDLTTCELFEIPQYKCEVQQPVTETSIVQCNKIERFFRRQVILSVGRDAQLPGVNAKISTGVGTRKGRSWWKLRLGNGQNHRRKVPLLHTKPQSRPRDLTYGRLTTASHRPD